MIMCNRLKILYSISKLKTAILTSLLKFQLVVHVNVMHGLVPIKVYRCKSDNEMGTDLCQGKEEHIHIFH